jgi:hypothetical protein
MPAHPPAAHRQYSCLVQKKMGRLFPECLSGISGICQGDDEVMAQVALKDWLCC